MKILHYTLGLPPMRSGGLTRYVLDLMEEQSKENEVIHLYPGKIDLFNKKTRISRIHKNDNNIIHFQLINSLPLPLFRGIKNPIDFISSVSKDIYIAFLNKINPEIIHIHTLMGLHKEFLQAAKQLNLKLVYTTHDYFGICPTINLYKDHKGMICEDFEEGKGCAECCFNAMNTKKLLLTQTFLYPTIKKIKKKFKGNNFSIDVKKELLEINFELSTQYDRLRNYYLQMFQHIDFFHFNSKLTERTFRKYLPNIKGEVVDITHSGIRKVNSKKVNSNKIRIGYLGPLKEYKGFFVLLEAFQSLSHDYFELHLYGDDTKINYQENIYVHGSYSSSDLERIFSNLDVVVVPSVWNETFGFITLEALSYGTPVIVSSNVGSKDLVEESFGWVYSGETGALRDLLNKMKKKSIDEKRMNLIKEFKESNLESHVLNLHHQVYLKKANR